MDGSDLRSHPVNLDTGTLERVDQGPGIEAKLCSEFANTHHDGRGGLFGHLCRRSSPFGLTEDLGKVGDVDDDAGAWKVGFVLPSILAQLAGHEHA